MIDFHETLIILEGRVATSKLDILNAINSAINNGFAISVQYKAKTKPKASERLATSVRYVEPWGIGKDRRTRNLNLRAYQARGDSSTNNKHGYWKTFSVDNIIKVIVLDGEGGTGAMPIIPRPDFKPNDRHIEFDNYHRPNERREEPQQEPEQPIVEPTNNTEPSGYDDGSLNEEITKIKRLL